MKMIFIKSALLTFIVMFLAHAKVEARHIVGGDVTYRCVGISGTQVTFEITFIMYRDSRGGGANFDNPARFGLYRGGGDSWSHISTREENVTNVTELNLDTGNPCLEVPTSIGVQSGTYQFEITVNISETDNYMIAYQRCCRNNTIFNIVDPGDTGAAFSVTITPFAQRECDNSPSFNDFPPVVICANSLLEFDHSARDIDGDQIVYSFCTPGAAGGTDGVGFGDRDACTGITPLPANCRPPFDDVLFRFPDFSFDRPLGDDIQINQVSGLLSGIPTQTEQFVVGVCATTFRNGVEIGRISRDFQFNVTTCEVAVNASINATMIEDGNRFIVNQCGDPSVDFINLSTDEAKISSYRWEFDVLGDLVEFDTRDVSITFPDTGRYEGFLFLNDGGQFDNCKDSAEIIVNIFPSINADFEIDFDTCVAGPIDFIDLSVSGAGPIQAHDWNFTSTDVSNEPNPSFTYTTPGDKLVKLVVEDENECMDSIERTIRYFPVPPLIVVQPSVFIGCVPATIRFNNLSSPIDETYDIIWDFGDGNTVNEISPSHIYEETGVFSVGVDITSPLGCETSEFFENIITVLDSPTAGFSFTPENPSNFNLSVDFIDESENAVSWLWDFGGVGSLEQNPSFTFQDTGFVEVVQVVSHPSGCTDTLSILLDIEPLVTLHLPNAFTPNNDGLNDTFKGKGFFDGFQNYRMQIWNRWGELLYETNDPDAGWNGQKENAGTPSPVGVYVYTVEYIGPRGENENLKGHVSLLR